MPLVAQTAALPATQPTDEPAGFSADSLKAPFFLRCAAFLIDYMLLLAVPIAWLLFSRFFLDGVANISLSSVVWLFVLLAWVLNFIALPLVRGQTVGKMLAGITIVNKDGTPARLGRILLRNVIGYFISAAILGLGFLIAAVNGSGRSLHDLIAGTVVVRGRKRHL